MKAIRPLAFFMIFLFLLAACTSTQESTPTTTQSEATQPAPTNTSAPEPTVKPTELPAEETPVQTGVGMITTVEQMTRIEAAPYMGYHLNWSPDGNWLAYTVNDGDIFGLGLVDMQNAEFYLLNAELDGDLYNTWSADGSRLMIDGFLGSSQMHLHEILLPDDLTQPVLPEPLPVDGFSIMPSTSPDGENLAYFNGQQLMLYNFSAQSSTPIPNTEGGMHPHWAPDGSRILFTGVTGSDMGLYVINPDGNDLQSLTSDFDWSDRGAWSPDGKWITFVSDASGSRQIWLLSMETGKLTQLTELPTDDSTWLFPSMPVFSSDGQWIALSYDYLFMFPFEP